jgi:hypothetical protein
LGFVLVDVGAFDEVSSPPQFSFQKFQKFSVLRILLVVTLHCHFKNNRTEVTMEVQSGSISPVAPYASWIAARPGCKRSFHVSASMFYLMKLLASRAGNLIWQITLQEVQKFHSILCRTRKIFYVPVSDSVLDLEA